MSIENLLHNTPKYQADARVMYWPILKNGHTSLDRWTIRVGFHNYGKPELPEDATHFFVLRDPFERYISSVQQMFVHDKEKDVDWETYLREVEETNQLLTSEGKNVWTSNGDIHFQHQADVMALLSGHVHHSQIKSFKLENVHVMKQWLEDEYGLYTDAEVDHKNPGSQDKDLAREILSQSPIVAHYAADILLWHGAE
jgi:hypothetical protein